MTEHIDQEVSIHSELLRDILAGYVEADQLVDLLRHSHITADASTVTLVVLSNDD